jgi:hypothetical protein
MKKYAFFAAAVAMTVAIGPADAQTSSQRNPIADILGGLFGDRLGVTTSIEAQWAAGRTPLATQRTQFESRVDAAVRAGTLTQATGTRLKIDYAALVQLETRYGADRRFTTQERNELADRYGELTQVLTEGDANSQTTAAATVALGRAEFDQRVNARVAARRLTRTQGTRLKTDYSTIVQLEADYLRDGVISASEQDDLDSRLDALDLRVGDTALSAIAATPRLRLDAIARALPASGLSTAAQAQLRVEHEDLSRLEAAYSRLSVSADDRAYLERRLVDLETRVRIRR